VFPILIEKAGNPNKKRDFFGWLHSVEVAKWRIPVDREGFLAFGVSAHKVLFNDFTVKVALQRLFKRICGMNLIWRRSFKNPVTVRAFEANFGCRHNAPSTITMPLPS
jgi:hypothetical protein